MVMHWKREGGPHAKFYMLINGLGAVATGCTVVIVLVAKFTEGAWITVLTVPLVILLMRAVNRHYVHVSKQTELHELEVHPEERPLAVLPVSSWNKASQAALDFACTLTPEVHVLHVECPDEHNECSSEDWQGKLDAASGRAGRPAPTVIQVPSPFRFIASPILQYVKDLETKLPGRKIAVVVPELVAQHWYQYLLHNHRSTALKGLLLMQGSRNVIVINVPWYLDA